ncbi:MAG: hypothetical protein IPH62_16445 [Ignavibacteriae bacterium]|nr:hypothetical protein [Ignavibacteriota bacterium]
MAFKYEYELEDKVIAVLQNHTNTFLRQFPLFNRVIDFVAIDKNDNVFGIEFKLNNCKKVLEQAKKNKSSFDYFYICLPQKNFKYNFYEKVKEAGIGLMLYDDKKEFLEYKILASSTCEKWYPNLEYIRNLLNNNGNYFGN